MSMFLGNFRIIQLFDSWQKFSCCEISYKIESRFYQEVLSPDLSGVKNLRKDSADFVDWERYTSKKARGFLTDIHWIPKIRRVDPSTKILEISSSFLSCCVKGDKI